MNAKRISDIFKRLYLTNATTSLGRWNNHNYTQTTLKIKYANEDNCYVSCMHVKEDPLDHKYIYMMGYESAHKDILKSRT
jgi:hypothetical protein